MWFLRSYKCTWIFDMNMWYDYLLSKKFIYEYVPSKKYMWLFSMWLFSMWTFDMMIFHPRISDMIILHQRKSLLILFHMITWYEYFMKENSFYASQVFFVSLLNWLFLSLPCFICLHFGLPHVSECKQVHFEVSGYRWKCESVIFFFPCQTVVLNHT